MIDFSLPERQLVRICRIVALVTILLMVAHVTLDVAMRYLFHAPLPGTVTYVAYWHMALITFLSFGVIEAEEGHISVELVYDMVPSAVQWVFRLISILVSLAVFGLLTARGFEAAMNNIGSYQNDAMYRIPTWPTYFLLPFGCGLAVLVLIRRGFNHLTNFPSRQGKRHE